MQTKANMWILSSNNNWGSPTLDVPLILLIANITGVSISQDLCEIFDESFVVIIGHDKGERL